VLDPARNPRGDQPAVTIKNLVKGHGSVVAVDDVSFSIQEGEIFGIIGPNGAGKTTTVEGISGLRVPDSGSISVYGFAPQRDRDWIGDLTTFGTARPRCSQPSTSPVAAQFREWTKCAQDALAVRSLRCCAAAQSPARRTR
jgi:ABC-type branched-subunit amino acid transport system ATPase component